MRFALRLQNQSPEKKPTAHQGGIPQKGHQTAESTKCKVAKTGLKWRLAWNVEKEGEKNQGPVPTS